jgi:hypothetical protein
MRRGAWEGSTAKPLNTDYTDLTDGTDSFWIATYTKRLKSFVKFVQFVAKSFRLKYQRTTQHATRANA